MSILALDIATRTGWALSSGRSGVLDLSKYKHDYGDMGYQLAKWFWQMIREHAVTIVVVERPFYRGAAKSVYMLNGLAFVVQMAAAMKVVERREYTVFDVRLRLLGKKKATKAEVIKWAEDQGFEPEDDNEADALALLTYALEIAAE